MTARIIQAIDGGERAFWNGVWWVDDPLDAQPYEDDAEDAQIDAEAAGPPDGMPSARIESIDASSALSLRRRP